MDVVDREAVEKAAQEVDKEFGRLDVLINNAGYLEKFIPIADSDPNDWWKTWTVVSPRPGQPPTTILTRPLPTERPRLLPNHPRLPPPPPQQSRRQNHHHPLLHRRPRHLTRRKRLRNHQARGNTLHRVHHGRVRGAGRAGMVRASGGSDDGVGGRNAGANASWWVLCLFSQKRK